MLWQCVVLAAVILSCLLQRGRAELLQNGNFESTTMDPWHCWNLHCELIPSGDSRLGTHAIKASGRTHTYEGPSQDIHPVPGKIYRFSSYMKILQDNPHKLGQSLILMVSFGFNDGTHSWLNVAHRSLVSSRDGWIHLDGDFSTPDSYKSANVYYQGPDPAVDYAVDQASISEIVVDSNWRQATDANIDRYRKSDIRVNVQAAAGINPAQVQIHLLQTKKSFPFGTAVNSWRYVNSTQQKYRDFIHKHFNWATLENALKWGQLEWTRGHYNYERALQTIHGLRSHGLKVRGHNMVWSLEQYVQPWVKAQSGDQLRATVRQHMQWTLNLTRGLLEHWDVNNENLHDQWYENRLMDRDYDLELFRVMHQIDPYPKLFLNDYGVVATGATTSAYREQGLRFKNASVHLYGMGVQSHFGLNVDPNPTLIKQRLDVLASVGVPLWTTELDVANPDENVRADGYEKALRALYSHPAIEGIVFWGFWGDIQSGGQAAALVTGPNLQLTAAGRRVLDLFENQWMTDVTHAGGQFTVRGFHGDYELHVLYQGHDRADLKQTFTLGSSAKTLTVNVH